MENIMYALLTVCVGSFALISVTSLIATVFNLVEDRKRAKREAEREARDIEYHELRMQELRK